LSKEVSKTHSDELASAMIGSSESQSPAKFSTSKETRNSTAASVLSVTHLTSFGDRGQLALNDISFDVSKGEILGLAGVSGNGQKELLEALTGQRTILSGEISISGHSFQANRAQNQSLLVRGLPEEPLINACVSGMTVEENLSLRDFDEAEFSKFGFISWSKLRQKAKTAIAEYSIKTSGPEASIAELSGGNIQRVVLARELSKQANVLLVSNATFGLDFAATQEIRNRLIAARNTGTSILLISEDLDEILELSDRIAVISSGRIVHMVASSMANRQTLGSYMAGERQELESIP
jgi:simple sugar transport system ATP-binding protein